MSKIFVFGIGGTGARVLRSLTHLLSAGVECNCEIRPLLIDPDMNNGDLTRCVALLQDYVKVRKKLSFASDCRSHFFRTAIGEVANTNFRMPIPQTQNVKFKDFVDMDNMPPASAALMKMLYSDDNLGSDMVVGFKGNPNIGSIVLNQFTQSDVFQQVANEFTQGDSIFIISSIFGGTGASGFPLFLKTLRSNQTLPNFSLINNAPIGAVTVLPYFRVQQDANSSIDSSTFVSKTKAALTYYEKNIGNGIDALYYIGDDAAQQSYPNNEGGDGQRNKAHIVELLAAMAIVDFSNQNWEGLQNGSRQPVYKEFGMATDVKANEIIFSDFATGTQTQICQAMTQFYLLRNYIMHYNLEVLRGQQWFQSGGFGDGFMNGEFMNSLYRILADYYKGDLYKGEHDDDDKGWLDGLAGNGFKFTPFVLDESRAARTPLDLVRTDIKGGTSIYKGRWGKKNYALFDFELDKAYKETVTKEQTFMELFYAATKKLSKKS